MDKKYESPSPSLSIKEEEKPDHVHVRLPSGAIANVSPDASPELLDALDKMCEQAKKMIDSESTPISRIEKEPCSNDGIDHRIESEKMSVQYEKEQGEEGEMFAAIKMDVGYIFWNHIQMSADGKAIEGNPAVHRIAEYIVAKLQSLTAENTAFLQVNRELVAQNEALCEERDRYKVSWDEREKVMRELEKERDEYRHEIEYVADYLSADPTAIYANELRNILAKYPKH
jgi:hypothetical protein